MRRHIYGEMVEIDKVGYSKNTEHKNISKLRDHHTCTGTSKLRKCRNNPHGCINYETVGRSRISLAIILHLFICTNNIFPACRALVIPPSADLSSNSIAYLNDDEDKSSEQPFGFAPVGSTEEIGSKISKMFHILSEIADIHNGSHLPLLTDKHFFRL